MPSHRSARRVLRGTLGCLAAIATCLQVQHVSAAAAPSVAAVTPAAAAAHAAAPAARGPVHYRPDRFAGRAGVFYREVWGIDDLQVRWAESGEMIRFSYHVLNPQRAQPLNEKTAQPMLIDPTAGVSLVIPTMDNIGQLRQSAQAEAGKSYWMAFSNKGLPVKRGDRVDVVIGTFHASGLVVD